MDVEEALEYIDRDDRFVVEETPMGVKMGGKLKDVIEDDDPDVHPQMVNAGTDILDRCEDDVVDIYEAVEEFDGERQREEVGRIIAESDVDELPTVVGMTYGIPLGEEECRDYLEPYQE